MALPGGGEMELMVSMRAYGLRRSHFFLKEERGFGIGTNSFATPSDANPRNCRKPIGNDYIALLKKAVVHRRF
jgi:hypothetical protein